MKNINIELINGKVDYSNNSFEDGRIDVNGSTYKFPFTHAQGVLKAVYDLYTIFVIKLDFPSQLLKLKEHIDPSKNYFLWGGYVEKPKDLAKLVNDAEEFGLHVIYSAPSSVPSKKNPLCSGITIKNQYNISFEDVNLRIKVND